MSCIEKLREFIGKPICFKNPLKQENSDMLVGVYSTITMIVWRIMFKK